MEHLSRIEHLALWEKNIERFASEREILFCCSRSCIDEFIREKLRELVQNHLDWRYLRDAARNNAMGPLLYHHLQEECSDLIPSTTLNQLRDDVQALLVHSENCLAQLFEILDLFKAHQIPVIPFKGLTFAFYVHSTLSLRVSGDIDLLVHREDFLRAKNLLICHGYRDGFFGHAEVSTVQAQLGPPSGRVSVDLHYGLTPHYMYTDRELSDKGSILNRRDWGRLDTTSTYWFFFLDCEPLWARLRPLTIAGRTVHVFAPEDMLLVAIINGIKENWRKIKYVTDIADLIRAHPEMDWNYLFGQVRFLRCERRFLLALSLAHELCGMPLPNEILKVVSASPTLRSMTEQVRYRNCLAKYSPDNQEFRLLSELLTTDNLGDMARYLFFIARRLRRFGFGPSDYFSFLRMFMRQIGLIAGRWLKSG